MVFLRPLRAGRHFGDLFLFVWCIWNGEPYILDLIFLECK